MRRPPLTHDEARGIVHARLGRPAQDVLEAAVVLEAWGGAPPEAALRLGAGALSREPPDARGRWSPGDADGREGILAEGVALLMAILAIAAWAGPLSRQLGPAVLAAALCVALPVTLALQWAIRSRYLGRRAGLACLAEDRLQLGAIGAVVAASLVVLPDFGPIAAMLVAIWVGGTVLARRGWGIAYGTLLVGEAAGLSAGLPARASLALLTGVTLLAVALAVATVRGPSIEPPGRIGRAAAAGLIGALLGGLLVGDASLGWGIHGAFPALALVPSVVGSFWGGYHLWQFHEEIPRGLRGVPLADASGPIAHGPATEIVLGALVRLVGITAALSALVLAAAPWTDGADAPSLLVAFGCAALVCLFVSLLESLGYVRWAFVSAAASLAVELACNRLGAPVAGAGLIAGGTVGTALALAPLAGVLRFPGRVLATALWIR
jgi:hypothetical protein